MESNSVNRKSSMNISVLPIKFHRLGMISRYEESIHIDRFRSERMKLRLVCES